MITRQHQQRCSNNRSSSCGFKVMRNNNSGSSGGAAAAASCGASSCLEGSSAGSGGDEEDIARSSGGDMGSGPLYPTNDKRAVPAAASTNNPTPEVVVAAADADGVTRQGGHKVIIKEQGGEEEEEDGYRFRMRDLRAGYDGEALSQFYYDVLVPSFPDKNDRDPLCDMQDALQEEHAAGQQLSIMHVILYEFWSHEEDCWKVGGGTLLEYYPTSQTALLGYIAVSKAMRGRGVGKTLIQECIRMLREEYGQDNLRGFFAETLSADAEDGDFPTAFRQRFFHGLGFRQVSMPYITPVLSGCVEPSFHYTIIVHEDTIPASTMPKRGGGEKGWERAHGTTDPHVMASVVHAMLVDYFNSTSGDDRIELDRLVDEQSDGEDSMDPKVFTPPNISQRRLVQMAKKCPYFRALHAHFVGNEDEEVFPLEKDHPLPLLDLPWKQVPFDTVSPRAGN